MNCDVQKPEVDGWERYETKLHVESTEAVQTSFSYTAISHFVESMA